MFGASRFQRLHNYVGPGHGSVGFARLDGNGGTIRSFSFVTHLLDPFGLTYSTF
jgi:hypothetical protein